jgi:hypothetical protein
MVGLDADELEAQRNRKSSLGGELLDDINQISKVLVSTLKDTANN